MDLELASKVVYVLKFNKYLWNKYGLKTIILNIFQTETSAISIWHLTEVQGLNKG